MTKNAAYVDIISFYKTIELLWVKSVQSFKTRRRSKQINLTDLPYTTLDHNNFKYVSHTTTFSCNAINAFVYTRCRYYWNYSSSNENGVTGLP